MPLTLRAECPICDQLLFNRQLTRTGKLADVHGDFQRDPGQHVHFDDSGTATGANGHRFRITVSVIAERRPNA